RTTCVVCTATKSRSELCGSDQDDVRRVHCHKIRDRAGCAVIVVRLELVHFRDYVEASFDLEDGVTAVLGRNGQGKTNFAEALAYLATLSSFAGAPPAAMIRVAADTAVIRATVRDDDRSVLIEAELSRVGRNR